MAARSSSRWRRLRSAGLAAAAAGWNLAREGAHQLCRAPGQAVGDVLRHQPGERHAHRPQQQQRREHPVEDLAEEGEDFRARPSPREDTTGSSQAPVRPRSFQAVTEAAHGGDAHRPLLDLLAQAVDVDLDRVVRRPRPIAQAFHQLVLADQAAERCSSTSSSESSRAESLDHLVVEIRHAAGGVERQRAVLDDAGGAQPAPRERTHARFQLLQRERLGRSRRRPGPGPFTRCSTLSAAVRMSTGTALLPRARSFFSTSKPCSLGRPRSRIRRSNTCAASAASASPLLPNWSTA